MAGESELRRAFYMLGSLTLAGAILYWTRPVMVPLTIAVLTTFILTPIVTRLERWRMPRIVACIIALVGIAALFFAIGYGFVEETGPLARQIPEYKAQILEKLKDVRVAAGDSWIASAFDLDEGNQAGEARPNVARREEAIATKVEIPVLALAQSAAGIAAEIVFNAVLVFFLALLMLMRREDLRNRIVQLMGADNRVTITRALDDASRRVSRFLFFQLVINLCFGAVVAVGLHLIGIPYAYVWGALAALLRYVPIFGGWIAALFPLGASIVMPSWTPFFLTTAFFVVIELIQANLVEPLVYGHSVGVSGPGQVVAMLFWATLWGPVGLILSTPLTACLCVVGHHFPGMRFFATLMGEEDIIEKPSAFYQRLLAGDSAEATAMAEAYLKERSFAALVDELIIPALLASRSDVRNGDLSKDDQIAIAEALREIHFDLAASNVKEAEPPASVEAGEGEQVLVVEFPFNDELDELVIEMLRNTPIGARARWQMQSIGNGTLDQLAQQQGIEPKLIIISTSARKNLPRIRGALKTVHRMFPDADLLICCWCLESESEIKGPPLKDAGVNAAVCTTFEHAQTLIEKLAAAPPASPSPAADETALVH